MCIACTRSKPVLGICEYPCMLNPIISFIMSENIQIVRCSDCGSVTSNRTLMRQRYQGVTYLHRVRRL